MNVLISLREAYDYLINGWFPRMFDWMFYRVDVVLDAMKRVVLDFIQPILDSSFVSAALGDAIKGLIDFIFLPYYFFGGEQLMFVFLLEQALTIFLILHLIKLVRSAIGGIIPFT